MPGGRLCGVAAQMAELWEFLRKAGRVEVVQAENVLSLSMQSSLEFSLLFGWFGVAHSDSGVIHEPLQLKFVCLWVHTFVGLQETEVALGFSDVTLTVAELIFRCADSSLPVVWLRHELLS